ncbi:hypothetical protein RI367_002253 [Sorochytrium milnesiophthora]
MFTSLRALLRKKSGEDDELAIHKKSAHSVVQLASLDGHENGSNASSQLALERRPSDGDTAQSLRHELLMIPPAPQRAPILLPPPPPPPQQQPQQLKKKEPRRRVVYDDEEDDGVLGALDAPAARRDSKQGRPSNVVIKTLLTPEQSSFSVTVDKPESEAQHAHPLAKEIQLLLVISEARRRTPEKYRYIINLLDYTTDDMKRSVLMFPRLGRELATHISRDLLYTASIMRMMLTALQSIHELHVCHLDVNPTNLLFDVTDTDLVLIDFGLARLCDGTPHPAGRGTRGYVAPELYPPHMCTTTYPDLYSAGIIFGQLLAPYYVECNLRILGGSASYPSHVAEVWQRVRDYIETDLRNNEDIMPPFLQCAGDLLLRLLTSSTPSRPTADHAYHRLSATQALQHPFFQIIQDPQLQQKYLAGLSLTEWQTKQPWRELAERRKRKGLQFGRIYGSIPAGYM